MKVTKASPSPPKYLDFEHIENITPTATFVNSSIEYKYQRNEPQLSIRIPKVPDTQRPAATDDKPIAIHKSLDKLHLPNIQILKLPEAQHLRFLLTA